MVARTPVGPPATARRDPSPGGAAPGGAQLPRGVLSRRAAEAGLHRQEELHAALALARSQRLSVPGLHRF